MLEVLGVVLITLAAVGAYSYHQRIRGRLKAEQDRYADLFTKYMLSEELRVKSQVELDFLKTTVVQMLQRPVQALIDDNQVRIMTEALTDYWKGVWGKN